MENYSYNEYILNRIENSIIIGTSDGRLVKKVLLTFEGDTIGKLNLPLSNICTMACKYCSEATYNASQSTNLSLNDGIAIVNEYINYVQNKKSVNTIRLSFDYGGEPSCQLDSLQHIVDFFRKRCADCGKTAIVQVTTNATCSAKQMENLISIVDEIIVSMDGYQELHEKYRVHLSGKSFYAQIMDNAKTAYRLGKLKQISSVITKDTLEDIPRYANFFIQNFPNTHIKVSPAIVTGAAETNRIERLSGDEWRDLVRTVKEIAGESIILIDSKPEKRMDKIYLYGCEHMNMCNWFCWLNGSITCCTDRESESYIIGHFKDAVVCMNFRKMEDLTFANEITHISKCEGCLAKYYCAGGCPSFRNGKINCDRRIEKYAKLLTELK